MQKKLGIILFEVVGAPASTALKKCGALRRGGSLFVKSSAKTFLGGTAVVCVIFGGEALASPPVRAKYGQKKASFLLPVFGSDLGDSFRLRKESPENDLDSTRFCVFWGICKGGADFGGELRTLLQKFFLPLPQAHRQPQFKIQLLIVA